MIIFLILRYVLGVLQPCPTCGCNNYARIGRYQQAGKLVKRPATAYIQWYASNKASLKSCTRTSRGVAVVAGETWRSMSIEEKQPWLDKAAADRKAYEKQIQDLQTAAGAPLETGADRLPPDDGVTRSIEQVDPLN